LIIIGQKEKNIRGKTRHKTRKKKKLNQLNKRTLTKNINLINLFFIMEKIDIPGASGKDIEKTALKYSVKNAYEHDGEAQVGAVVGKVKALFPDIIIGQVMPTIKKVVDEVNSFNKEELKERYELFANAGWELKQVEKEKKLPELNWLREGEKIITRAAPCPTGAMHFGHARPYILLDEYIKKYGGKYFMRFDDTDPKIKIPEEGIEQEFLDDFKWLGIKVDKVFRESDNLKRHLKVIEQLLAEGKAYVCFCKPEEWREKIWKSKACPCREKEVKEQLKHWKEMLKGKIKEGTCVVRLKTDLKEKDPSVRDWWMAKIVDDATKHPNKKTHKFHVWPSYNLASAVDDYDMRINFTIRGQEHIQNEKKQRYLYDYFGWEYPHTMYHGKVSQVGDMILSKSKIKILMEKEGLKRDDDPRLATIKSFRRRGFKAEAIRKVVFNLGLNPNDAKINMENFASANKEFLNNVSSFPFIEDGIEIEIMNCKKGKVEVYGNKIEIGEAIEKIIVDKKELKKFKEEDIVRLKDGFNIKLKEVSEYGAKADFISYEKSGYKSLNWLKDNEMDAKILMNDGKERIGMTSASISREKGVVLLLNLGYVHIEIKEKGKEVYCIFTHE
jgi:glutamyl-tRNA synthetase